MSKRTNEWTDEKNGCLSVCHLPFVRLMNQLNGIVDRTKGRKKWLSVCQSVCLSAFESVSFRLDCPCPCPPSAVQLGSFTSSVTHSSIQHSIQTFKHQFRIPTNQPNTPKKTTGCPCPFVRPSAVNEPPRRIEQVFCIVFRSFRFVSARLLFLLLF